MSAELVGIDGMTLAVYDAALKVNQAKDTDNNLATNPAKIDWTTFFSDTTGLEPASVPNVGSGVDIEASGSVILNAFGVVMAKGSFKLQLGTTTKGTTDYQAVVLTLGENAFSGASAVEVFIGVGGAIDDNDGGTATPSNYSDDTINIDAGVGFHATLNNLSLVTLKDNRDSVSLSWRCMLIQWRK